MSFRQVNLNGSAGSKPNGPPDKENHPASRAESSDEEDDLASDGPTSKNHPKAGVMPASRARKRASAENSHHWSPFQKQVQTLISNGLSTTMQLELDRVSESDLSRSEATDLALYQQLLSLSPGLEERLNTGSEQDMIYVASMITKGISSARSDDTKSLKSAIVDWITPHNQYLNPPLQRNVKTDRGFHHYRTGELLCPVNLNWRDDKIRRDLKSGQLVPSGDLWPRFIYKSYEYNQEDPWEGLFRSNLLVQAYKHVFTSPSSVYASNGASKATRSSNARLHGMTHVTVPSIAYIATQVRFALSSSSTFSRTDLVTDSEYFYDLIIDLLEDPDEKIEVAELLTWWNQQIFPVQMKDTRSIHNDSVISKIKERRRLINEGVWPPPRSVPARTARKGANAAQANRGRRDPSSDDDDNSNPSQEEDDATPDPDSREADATSQA